MLDSILDYSISVVIAIRGARCPFVVLITFWIAMPPGREDEARAFYHGILGLDEKVKPPQLIGARRVLV
jgi:hypothetical protein